MKGAATEQVLHYADDQRLPELPLFDAIFVAGLYHDHVKDEHVPFTRDCYPKGVTFSVANCTYFLNVKKYFFIFDVGNTLVTLDNLFSLLCANS